MRKILKNMDRFAISPRLNIDSVDSHQTYTGGIFSIIVFSLVVLAAVNFSQNLVYKMNPNIVTSESNFAVIPKFNLSDYKLGYFLNTFNMGKIIDPTVFTITAGTFRSMISLDGTQASEQGLLELDRCAFEYFEPFDDKDILRRLSVNKNMCFSQKETKNLKLEGGWGQNVFDLIYVDFNICRNSTSNGYF
jgi:hypothetical protein